MQELTDRRRPNELEFGDLVNDLQQQKELFGKVNLTATGSEVKGRGVNFTDIDNSL
jgi:hypothetical protein